MTLTPAGRLLKRSANPADRPAVFAAQFSLSHACWLLTYPLAGFLGAKIGMSSTFAILALLTAIGVAIAWWVWPVTDVNVVAHAHPSDARLDEHLAQGERTGPDTHRHPFAIDDNHRRWPDGRR